MTGSFRAIYYCLGTQKDYAADHLHMAWDSVMAAGGRYVFPFQAKTEKEQADGEQSLQGTLPNVFTGGSGKVLES